MYFTTSLSPNPQSFLPDLLTSTSPPTSPSLSSFPTASIQLLPTFLPSSFLQYLLSSTQTDLFRCLLSVYCLPLCWTTNQPTYHSAKLTSPPAHLLTCCLILLPFLPALPACPPPVTTHRPTLTTHLTICCVSRAERPPLWLYVCVTFNKTNVLSPALVSICT